MQQFCNKALEFLLIIFRIRGMNFIPGGVVGKKIGEMAIDAYTQSADGKKGSKSGGSSENALGANTVGDLYVCHFTQ